MSDSANGLRRRRAYGRAAALLSAVVLIGAAGCQRATPPNIVLYVVDTLRADALHCYGNDAVQTPAADRLAAEGLRFARAYANASWTRASMGTLLTGLYPNTHGAVGRLDALHPAIATLPAGLRAAGYRTAAIIANPNIGATFGFAAGFDEFIELYEPHSGHAVVAPEELVAPADRVVDAAIGWLRRGGNRPFFLFVFTIDPHAPYTPPAPYNRLYDADYTGSVDGSLQSIFALSLSGSIPPEREIRHLRALYLGEVTFNDAQFDRLLSELDRLHLSDSTLVVSTSDHGEEFYEHGRRDHGHTLYEELVHVPLIVRWPGHVPAHDVHMGAVQLADLYPTLLHLAGSVSAAGPGRDLSNRLLGHASTNVASMAYAEEDLKETSLGGAAPGSRHTLQMVLREYRKLIYDAALPEPQTFDLLRDPGEHHPLAGLPPHDLVTAMEEIQQTDRPRGGSAAHRVRPTELPESARKAMEALGYGDPSKVP